MEESINGKKNIDSIAEITDGGKASVKNVSKKYNLRSFRRINNMKIRITKENKEIVTKFENDDMSISGF